MFPSPAHRLIARDGPQTALRAHVDVAVVCTYLDVPYELVPVDYLTGAHKTPAYLDKHPFSQVRYLDDAGFVLFESRAIARYVAAKYADGPPRDIQSAALFEQACSIEDAEFHAYALPLVIERWAKPNQGLQPHTARVAELEAALDGNLDGYERILAKHRYLAGNELTFADLFHLPNCAILIATGTTLLEDPARRPNVARWWKEITGLPAWQAVKDGA